MLLRTTSRLLRARTTATPTSISSSTSSRLPSTITSTRSYHATRVVASTAIVQHRDTKVNNAETPFEFTAESKKKIDWWLAKFPANYRQSAVMPLLVIAQEQNDNWIPLSAMNKIAQILDMPPIRVYEVATFYSMYNREPVGKYHIQLCGTTPCQLCGAETICETIEKHLKIKKGETTPDGLFTLTEVECLGACANAPMIQVNNHEFYENLTPETTIRLLENWKNGTPNKVGPQNGQRVAEGIMGKTTLKTEVKPVTRDLDALVQQVKAEQEKAKAEAAAKAAAAASAPKA